LKKKFAVPNHEFAKVFAIFYTFYIITYLQISSEDRKTITYHLCEVTSQATIWKNFHEFLKFPLLVAKIHPPILQDTATI